MTVLAQNVRVVEGCNVAFGQASGSPATGQQMRQLIELLSAAGHSDFRDARGPMRFTQRQAGGKFTRDEADAFIEQLNAELQSAPSSESTGAPPPNLPVAARMTKIAPRPQESVAPRARVAPKASTVESVRLDAVTKRRVMERAERDGTTISEVIKRALDDYL